MTTPDDRSGPESVGDPEYARQLGARLRAIREQRGWSLRDVHEASNGRFTGSAVGTYERGERGISVQRLSELAQLYGIPMELLLPETEPKEAHAPWRSSDAAASEHQGPEKVVIDLVALEARSEPEFDPLRRYIDTIKVQRGDYNGRVLSVRGTDVWAMAAVSTVEPGTLLDTLGRLNVLRTAPVDLVAGITPPLTTDVNLRPS